MHNIWYYLNKDENMQNSVVYGIHAVKVEKLTWEWETPDSGCCAAGRWAGGALGAPPPFECFSSQAR